MKRTLPAHVYRDHNGTLYYKRRRGKGWHRVTLETQFSEGAAVPFDLHAEVHRIESAPPKAPGGKTWAALIAAYKRSPDFVDLQPRTRADYEKVLLYIADKWGELDPRKAQRKDVIRMRDANAGRVRFANYCIQVVSVLARHMIDAGWRADNPAKGARQLKSDTPPRLPWPPHLVEAFRQAAPVGTVERLVFELCLGTGQRIGDVLRMTWGNLDGDTITLRQGKTGSTLSVPLTPHARAAVAATKREAITIVSRKGRPVSYRVASALVFDVRVKIGAEAYDLHALRHTTASELVALGCSDELVMAVTGHKTPGMVAHYTRTARQKGRAIEAQEKRK